MLAEFCDWLSRTAPSVAFQVVPWVVPAVQVVHILCIAMLVTCNLMLGLRLMGVCGRSRSIAQVAGEARPWTWGPLAGLATTGAAMIVAEPARELVNAVFWTKMALLVLAIALTIALHRALRRDPRYWDETASRSAALAVGAASTLLWVSIVVAGRLIAYAHG